MGNGARFSSCVIVCLCLWSWSIPAWAQSATVAPFLTPRQQFYCGGNTPCAAGKLYACVAGTSCPGNPQETYTDSTGTTANSNPIILDANGAATVWLSSAAYKFVLQNASGVQQWTLDQITWTTPLSTFAGITTKSMNRVQFADQFPGKTADAQITNCLAAIPYGGVCDARGYGRSTQTLAATITVNPEQTLLFDPSTSFQAAVASLNLFTFEPDAVIRGFSFDCSNQNGYSGNIFQNDPSKVYANGSKTAIEDIDVKNQVRNSTCGSSGNALMLNSTSDSTGVAFLTLRHWRIWGLANGALLTSSSPRTVGFVNGNHFIDWVCSNSTICFHLTNAGGQLDGNEFVPFSCEYDATAKTCIQFDGTCAGADTARFNFFLGVIWDYTTPAVFNNPCAQNNRMVGRFDGTPNDPLSLNNWENIHNATEVLNTMTLTNGGGIIGGGTIMTSNASPAAVNVPNGGVLAGSTITSQTGIRGAGGNSPLITGDNSSAYLPQVRMTGNVLGSGGHVLESVTAPSISADGCGGTAAAIASNNGTASFTINVGRDPASDCTVTMPPAATDWVCSAVDVTTSSTSVFVQKISATSSGSVTITNYNNLAGPTPYMDRDQVKVQCTAE